MQVRVGTWVHMRMFLMVIMFLLGFEWAVHVIYEQDTNQDKYNPEAVFDLSGDGALDKELLGLIQNYNNLCSDRVW